MNSVGGQFQSGDVSKTKSATSDLDILGDTNSCEVRRFISTQLVL